LDPATLELRDLRLSATGRYESLQAAIERTAYRLEAYAENIPEGLPSSAISDMTKGQPKMLSGSSRKDVAAYAFGAHFVELRIHSRTREVRVKRTVSAFAAGTIVNPMTAHSQFMGGTIWGLSSALHEESEIGAKSARYVNDNLADYLIPVNADVPDIEIIMVSEADNRVNPLGIKGIGEIGIVGMNAAVANAVFNATGKRIRSLPIRPEKLL
jgi:xanthine dehydrogenase YagR molybdenum-binding subunit